MHKSHDSAVKPGPEYDSQTEKSPGRTGPKYRDDVHFVGKKDTLEVRIFAQTDNYPENVNRELKTRN